MLATLKVIIFSTDQIHVETLKNEGWRRLLQRAGPEHKKILKNKKNGLLEMIRNKIMMYLQDKEEKDAKTLPEGVELNAVRTAAEKIVQQEDIKTMTFAKWYYTLQHELSANLINFITVIENSFWNSEKNLRKQR